MLARAGKHQDPAYLAATIMRCGVTTLHVVPSMLDASCRSQQRATAGACGA